MFKSQNKVLSILGHLLETIFLISTIISILLFLAKITILPPNQLGFMGVALAALGFLLLFKHIVAFRAILFFKFIKKYRFGLFLFDGFQNPITLWIQRTPYEFEVFIQKPTCLVSILILKAFSCSLCDIISKEKISTVRSTAS